MLSARSRCVDLSRDISAFPDTVRQFWAVLADRPDVVEADAWAAPLEHGASAIVRKLSMLMQSSFSECCMNRAVPLTKTLPYELQSFCASWTTGGRL
jgi:hypothetical protein